MNTDLSNAVTAARLLLGKKLVHDSPEGRTAGYIVETEAYTMSDPASHSFRGMTLRNAAMFAEAGTVYVYFTYGMHYCLNIVCGREGQGEAVLIRALEPIEGIELMRTRRKISDVQRLTSGPAKLTQAMGIDLRHNSSNLAEGPLYIRSGFSPKEIVSTTRVGIKKAADTPWRFFVMDNPFVSNPIDNI